MLARLFVQNFALIDRLEVHLGPGLNLLTGETGAGKSLLVDAIGLILGRRADPGVMLDQSQKCIVEAEFRLHPNLLAELRQVVADFQPADDDEATGPDLTDETFIVRREIAPSGKSRAFINDTPVNLAQLRELTSRVVDLHGQHEGIRLLDPAVQLQILDQYAGIVPQADQFEQQLNHLRHLDRTLLELRQQAAEAQRQQDYVQHQFQALHDANLQPGEDEQIDQQLSRLEHTETIVETLGRMAYLLEGEEGGIVPALKTAVRELERAAAVDARLLPDVQRLTDARFALAEVAANLQSLAEATELDPAAIEALGQRRDTYNKLKLKFSVRTADELIALRDQFQAQLDTLTATPERIAQLAAEREQVATQLVALGLELERQRAETAAALSWRMNQLLVSAGLPKAELQIEVARQTQSDGLLRVEDQAVQPNGRGLNSVTFRVRTNPGTPMGTLQQVASGGEIARILLAVKTALAERLALATLIFDEIDTGISGEVALKVGRMMQALAEKHQLLTITHLPQIASRPGTHFFLYKEVVDDRTATRIRQLDGAGREDAIAQMIGGERPAESARASARDLLAAA